MPLEQLQCKGSKEVRKEEPEKGSEKRLEKGLEKRSENGSLYVGWPPLFIEVLLRK